jgi:hypothetical protein
LAGARLEINRGGFGIDRRPSAKDRAAIHHLKRAVPRRPKFFGEPPRADPRY